MDKIEAFNKIIETDSVTIVDFKNKLEGYILENRYSVIFYDFIKYNQQRYEEAKAEKVKFIQNQDFEPAADAREFELKCKEYLQVKEKLEIQASHFEMAENTLCFYSFGNSKYDKEVKNIFERLSRLVPDLFKQLSGIYNRHIQKEYTSGNKLNLFNLFNLSFKASTHTKFIAELLNPEGNHACGNLFFKSFVNILAQEIKFLPKAEDLIITIKTPDENTFITIKGSSYASTKINIYNFFTGKSRCLDSINNDDIVLTLNNIPETNNITFRNHILKWINNCILQASSKPSIVNSIKQYRAILIELTNQTLDNTMENEIKQLLINNTKYFDVLDIASGVKNEIIKEISNEIIEIISNLSITINDINIIGESSFTDDKQLALFFWFAKDKQKIKYNNTDENTQKLIEQLREKACMPDNYFSPGNESICFKKISCLSEYSGKLDFFIKDKLPLLVQAHSKRKLKYDFKNEAYYHITEFKKRLSKNNILHYNTK